jgi:acetate kinase
MFAYGFILHILERKCTGIDAAAQAWADSSNSSISRIGGTMKLLVINSGSSSLKYTLFEMEYEQILFSGSIDRIGLEQGVHAYQSDSDGPQTTERVDTRDHGDALDELFRVLTAGPLETLEELTAVAHRVGHGGNYKEAALVSDDVIREIRRMTPMVPLHHPSMVKEIEECLVRMPHATHVAVFDTSFHRTIPDKAAIYGLPYHYFAERGYRRTGFHGQSHQYVSLKAAEFMGKPIENLKLITCHLGNGASITAINHGKSIDTTLGMTAVEGLIMGTRSGDVDSGLLPVIMNEDSLSPSEMIDMLYRKSGLLGISGISRDMREIEAAALENARARLALDAFCYKVKRYIGAMLMALGGCDALVFTAGIGCNSPVVRAKALEGSSGLGFVLDESRNSELEKVSAKNPVLEISSEDSPIRILVVHTFEELMIARECLAVIEGTT